MTLFTRNAKRVSTKDKYLGGINNSTNTPNIKTLKKSLTALITMCALSACGGGSTSDKPVIEQKQTKTAYDRTQVLDVNIDLSTEDWDKLRHEGRQISQWSPACTFEGYNDYTATVTVNGETFEEAAVSKKGKIGTVTVLRPQFNIDLTKGEGNSERNYNGNSLISLNNNRQDPSNIKECLAYTVFEAAGIGAPLCTLAHVTAQGENLGTYVNIEPYKKPMLARIFGDDTGTMYQAARSGDFLESRIPFWSKKTNKDDASRADLESVVMALQADDADVWDALDAVVNMDQFLTFSVVESLLGHSNGYNGYQNNIVVYFNPADNNRLHFIPKGTEQALRSNYHLSKETAPATGMRASELMNRLWHTPGFQDRYDQRMDEVLATAWDENALKAEADRLAALVYADPDEVQHVIDFIDNRRISIEAERNDANRPWTQAPMGEAEPCPTAQPISGSFELYWSESPSAESKFSVIADEGEDDVVIAGGGFVRAGDRGDGVYAHTAIMVGRSLTGDLYMVALAVPPELWGTGEVMFHSAETTGRFSKLVNGEWVELGLTTGGSITFTEVTGPEVENGKVVGSFSTSHVIFN